MTPADSHTFTASACRSAAPRQWHDGMAHDYAESIGGPGPRAFKDEGQRIVCWFSHGDASATATKLILRQYGTARVEVLCIDVGSEHPDNERFRADCERWFGVSIRVVKSEKFSDTWDVWERERFLKGPNGAPCTRALKRNVREAHAGGSDIQVFGFTDEERDRALEFAWRNPEIALSVPLIEAGLSKSDCHSLVQRAGIQIPAMYRLGYLNNNCIGCVKGGMGYWNKIRRDFPATFDRMARLERELNHALIRETVDGARADVFLDELAPDRGRIEDEPTFECSLFCAATELDDAA